jgi:hypothetical protein
LNSKESPPPLLLISLKEILHKRIIQKKAKFTVPIIGLDLQPLDRDRNIAMGLGRYF